MIPPLAFTVMEFEPSPEHVARLARSARALALAYPRGAIIDFRDGAIDPAAGDAAVQQLRENRRAHP